MSAKRRGRICLKSSEVGQSFSLRMSGRSLSSVILSVYRLADNGGVKCLKSMKQLLPIGVVQLNWDYNWDSISLLEN